MHLSSNSFFLYLKPLEYKQNCQYVNNLLQVVHILTVIVDGCMPHGEIKGILDVKMGHVSYRYL